LDDYGEWAESIHPDDAELATQSFERITETGGGETREYRIVRADGSECWISDRGFAVYGEGGAVERIVGIAEDITERKRAEEALRQSEEKYRMLVDNIQDGVFIIQDGKMQFANEALARMIGYIVEQVIGMDFQELVAPEDLEIVVDRYHRRQAGEDIPREYELRMLHKDGVTRVLANLNVGLVDYRGRVATIGTVKDITERKQAAEKTRWLAKFPAENPNPVLRVAQDGTILYANEASSSLLNRWESQVSQSVPDEWREFVSDIIRSGSRKDAEVEYGNRIVSLTFAPVVDADYLNVYGIDITERKWAEEALRHYSERLQALHEIDQAILAAQSPRAIAQTVLDYIQRLLPSLSSSVTLFDLEANEAVIFAVTKNGEIVLETGSRIPLREDFVEPLRQGKVRVNEDLLTSAPQSPTVKALWTADVRSSVVAPLIVRGELVGSLNIGAEEPRAFDEGQIEIVREVADSLAVALQQAQLWEELQLHVGQVETSLREKEVMLQEIHHRVKNNLQVISSLLDMQSLTVDDATTLQVLQDSQSRVRSMALVHEKLYQSPDLASIDVAEYVYSVAAYLRQVYSTQGREITLDVQVDAVSLDLDTAIPCGLIINELVSNALKHAFPPEETGGGKVRIALRSPGDGQLSLMVSDDGVGMPPDMDFETPQTLGLQLVDLLTQQIEGTLDLDRDGGTTFEIRFPDRRAKLNQEVE
jgi:PAS domain S-box-containing protein